MEGLEISILPVSEALAENTTKRLDPEYFGKAAIEAFRLLKDCRRLGDYVKTGYRVVYENTKVIDPEVGEAAGFPLFLQSADITTPFINRERMAYVSEEDWQRYPKGRITPGELLIEVKGKAEKVAVVPDDFPKKTLVTGTCFKLETYESWQRSLIISHLLGEFGAVLKGRLKTNLLVSYIAKGDLYRIPVPEFGMSFNSKIHDFVENALRLRSEIVGKQEEANFQLISALGLADLLIPEPLTYSTRSSDTIAARRLDAQYFMPVKKQVKQALATLAGEPLADRVKSVRELWVPDRAPPTMRVRNYDVTDALVPLLDAEKEPSYAAEIGSMKKVLRDGDVAVSRLRAYLKEIAVVRTGDDIPSVGSSEFIVLRPNGPDISPETLMVFLRSAPVQTILKWCQDGSQHPRFSEGDLLSIPLPDAVANVSTKVTLLVQEGFTARDRARRLLDSAKRAVEIAIEDSEAAALAHLEQAEEAH